MRCGEDNNMTRLPTFVGIGGHKCASTWLSECMRDHPQIFVSEPKELAFFSNRYDKGLEWYSAFFKSSSKYRQAGEYTSHYIYHEKAPQRILETIGQVRVLAVIREPVARALSQIKYGIRHGFLDRPSARVISLPQLLQFIDAYSPIIDRSLYVAGIRRFMSAMGTQNVLVLDQYDCSRSPDLVLQRVWDFLDVDTNVVSNTALRRVSIGITPQFMILEKIRERLFYFVNARSPRLITLSRKFRIGEFYRRMNAGRDVELSSEAHDYLANQFAEDWALAREYCWRPDQSSQDCE